MGPQGRAGAPIPTPSRGTRSAPSTRAGAPAAQRLRVRFTKEEPLRFLGHLDVVRLWERACRRARLPLAYTLGFTPHPRLQFASPLALGATGAAEVLDLYLTAPLAPDEFGARLGARLPPGCRVVEVQEVPLLAPAAAALLRWAEYQVLAEREPGTPPGAAPPAPEPEGVPWRPPEERLPPPAPPPPLPPADVIRGRVEAFLGATSLPRQRQREGKTLTYDLRPLVLALTFEGIADVGGIDGARQVAALRMRLTATPQGQGRPEEVASALGLRATRVHRLRLGLAPPEAEPGAEPGAEP
jgi:Uncharacterized protein conserved in bacteria (DUF2344)